MNILKINALAMLIVLNACTVPASNNMPDNSTALQIEPIADVHTTANAVDWSGTYHGILPCADCTGIDTTLTINDDLSYHLIQKYQGSDIEDNVSGTFVWVSQGQLIQLDAQGDQRRFFIGENFAQQYNLDGSKPTDPLAVHYKLQKVM